MIFSLHRCATHLTMRRSKGLRVSVAIALLLTLVLVNRHVASIEPAHAAQAGDLKSEFVIEDGEGHIELVSVDRHPRAVVNSVHSSSPSAPMLRPPLQTKSNAGPSPTMPRWLEPTKPAPPTKFAPQKIPVDVPGEFFWGADYDEYLNELMEEEEEEEEEDNPWGAQLGQRHKNSKPTSSSPPKPKVTPKSDRIIVLGRMSYEDASWLEEELPEWQHAVYVVDDPNAEYTVQQNKGKESNVYLQYITDHYPNFPDYLVFLHAHRWSYHIEFPEQDNALTVQRLQLDHVKKAGYANLRCNWEPGCPEEVQPFRQLAGRTTEIAFAGAWMRIFNNTDVPEVVAVPCCAQFAVTREQILARPLRDYVAFHQWLMETELDDDTSGRVFEYLWHIIFGQDPVFCPSKEQCYMDTYNIEWDPSYDPPDTSWVDDSFWDDFDLDNPDMYEDENQDQDVNQDNFDVDTMDQDYMYSDNPGQKNMDVDDTIVDYTSTNDGEMKS